MWKILGRSHTNVHTIAYILGTVSIFGYVISFLRDRIFAHHFGATEMLDVYIASFRIPDLLFIATTAFISVYALLPMFEKKQKQGRRELREFINTTFCLLLIFLVLGAAVLFMAMPTIAAYFFSSFSPEAFETFVLFSRVFIIQAFLFAVSSFFTALLQLKRKFFLYSLLPIIYNVGIIFGVIVLYPAYGSIGLALGVLIGIVMSVGIQLPIIIRDGIVPVPVPTRSMMIETWHAVKMSVPRASALLSIGVANIIIFGLIVSISEGVLSVYYFADNLKAVPLVIVGTAYSVATFPILVNYVTEHNMGRFRDVLESSFRRLFFFILPLIAYIFALREPLISFFFESGLFTPETTIITATILGIFVFSALTMSVLVLCARAMYAYGKSLLPFLVFFSLAVAEVAGVYGVTAFLKTHREPLLVILEYTGLTSGGFGMLFATVITIVFLETIAALVLFRILVRTVGCNSVSILSSLVQHTVAAVILAAGIIITKNLFFADVAYNTFDGMIALACMTLVGFLLWYGILCHVANEECNIVRKQIFRILRQLRG